jgi:hypothetical protein
VAEHVAEPREWWRGQEESASLHRKASCCDVRRSTTEAVSAAPAASYKSAYRTTGYPHQSHAKCPQNGILGKFGLGEKLPKTRLFRRTSRCGTKARLHEPRRDLIFSRIPHQESMGFTITLEIRFQELSCVNRDPTVAFTAILKRVPCGNKVPSFAFETPAPLKQ